PPRTLMVSAANSIAVLCFVVAAAVRWRETLLLAVGALIGGYLGAHVGRRLDPRVVRGATIALSVAMTVAFFVRAAKG
ncbi:MAG: TSUP family transporter, partial [Phenylobacterium sp.]